MILLNLLVLFLFTSCAQYVDAIHRQIDREENISKSPRPTKRRYNPSKYKKRFKRGQDQRPIKNPKTYSLGTAPSVIRNSKQKNTYRPRRFNTNDFIDNESSGSLWTNQGSRASLFTYQNDKKPGDIIIINVLEALRNQISAELKRTFPDRQKAVKKDDENKDSPKDSKAPEPESAGSDQDMDMKIYDKISGTVMEEVNQDYILLRGRKDVIYKKEKRSIEIQALVSRKDIMENDYVNSDKLLESRVNIIGNRN